MLELTLILVLGAIALFLNAKIDVLQKDNDRLRDTIKRNEKFNKIDKKYSIENAILGERFKIQCEQFQKQCKEFQERADKI